MQIHGTCDPKFQAVKDTFAQLFATGQEVGASVCLTMAGETVVDLWAGYMDKAKTQPWQEDTITVFFSSTKGIMATAFMMLHDRGILDYEAPIAKYWPEFAQNGKEMITVAQFLDHRSGLTALTDTFSIEEFADWDAVSSKLAAQPPIWEPGSRQGYNGTTLGIFGTALFKKITGELIGDFIAREIAGPLGADLYVSLPPSEDDRVAEIITIPTATRVFKSIPQIITGKTVEGRIARGILNKSSATHRAMLNPDMGKGDPVGRFNDPEIRRLHLPWGNGVGNARSLATVYAALANDGEHQGTRLVSKEAIELVTPRRSWEDDAVLRKPLGFSLGYLKENHDIFSPNSQAFGHAGIGGSLGLADPVTKMSLGYVMNKMDPHLRSPRAIALCRAAYQSL